ncbi:hypothetical protein TNCV_2302361 [Trichonephila clavipes]|nr:hypothetical protein TNCV_2302361 [Trichonephila clavipes]
MECIRTDSLLLDDEAVIRKKLFSNFVPRDLGAPLDDQHLLSSKQYGGGSVILWSAFRFYGKVDIAFLSGRTAFHYEDVLDEHLLLISPVIGAECSLSASFYRVLMPLKIHQWCNRVLRPPPPRCGGVRYATEIHLVQGLMLIESLEAQNRQVDVVGKFKG